MKRHFAVYGIALALAAVGCGSDTETGQATPKSAASPALVSDEQQIRDFVAKTEPYVASLDFAKLAEFTCTKYKAKILALPDVMFPKLGAFGTPEELAAKPRDALIEAEQKQFPTVSHAAIIALVDSLRAYDEEAYKAAILEVTRQSTVRSDVKIDNIKVTGDTAVGDLTATVKMGNGMAITQTKPNAYLKENGVWTDCQDPAAG